MLRDGTPNPLTIHGIRELEHCPPHFIKVQFDLRGGKKSVSDWIWENLEGRFWFDDLYYLTDGGSIAMAACAAFEISGEASMFGLCLDQINHKNDLLY